MMSTIAIAAVGGLVATTATAVATGNGPAAVSAAHTAPLGLQVALSHVPSASHALDVLKQHLALYAGAGGAGTVATGSAAAAINHGLHLGLGR